MPPPRKTRPRKKPAAKTSATHATTHVTIGPAIVVVPRPQAESVFAPIDFEARQEQMRLKRRHPGLAGPESAKSRRKPSDVPPTTVKP